MTLHDIYIEERLKDELIEINVKDRKLKVVINQGTSFGGNHTTTLLSIEAIKFIINTKLITTALDLGSGSGILAIIIKKLGVLNVSASEIDQLAIKESKLNFKSNFNHKKDFPCLITDPLTNEDKYDFIVSNISGSFLPNNLLKISQIINPGGYLSIAGFNIEKEKDYVRIAKEANLQIIRTFKKTPWISMIFQRNV
tara:strand:+ start:69410 stop:70000 length:591 start_codon:yes stop_codon:yes gene_type:complete